MRRSQNPLRWVVAAAATCLLATAGAVVLGQQAPAPKPDDNPVGPGGAAPAEPPASQALAREQLALVDGALADLDRLARGGEVSFSDARFSLWGRRRLEALRVAGAGKAEIVAALEKYLASMKAQEKAIETSYRNGSASRVDVTEVRFRRMEAEIWRNREQAR